MATPFVCTINKTGQDYSTIALWEAAVQANIAATTVRVVPGVLTRGTIADAVAVTQTTTGATAVCAHHTATQMMITTIAGSAANDTDTWYPTADGNDTTNCWTPSGARDSVILEADCYDDSGALVVTAAQTIDGSTTSTTSYIKITAPVGERHNGTNASGFKITRTTSGNSQYILSISDDNVIVEWLIINLNYNGAHTLCAGIYSTGGVTSSGVIFRNNIIYATNMGATASGSGINHTNASQADVCILNCVIYGFTYGNGINISDTNDYRWVTIFSYNNTIYGNKQGTNTAAAPTNAGNSYACKNTISYNNSTFDYFTETARDTFSSTSTSNISKDTTVPLETTADSGTCDTDTENHLIDADQNFLTTVKVGMRVKNTTDTTYGTVTAVNSDSDLTLGSDLCPDGNEAYTIYKSFVGTLTFTNTTGGSEDFHLVSGDTLAIDNGTDLGTTKSVQFDIDNYDRDTTAVTWDIGADEYVATGVTTLTLSAMIVEG